MKKIISVASVGLLALAIFGCKKKTTKNTTKDNTTITTKTNTNTDSSTVKTTKAITTRNTTTEKETTINKAEFKEVSYETFKEKVDALSDTFEYKKIIVNGVYQKGDNPEEVETAMDLKFMIDEFDQIVTAAGPIANIEKYLTKDVIKAINDDQSFKFFMNENDEFKFSQVVDGVTTDYTFNAEGLPTKIEKMTDGSTAAPNLTFEWFLSDEIDGYELITRNEAQAVADNYAETNKYVNAYITGTYHDYYSGAIYTETNFPVYFKKESGGYVSYDTTVGGFVVGEFNGFKYQYLRSPEHTFFYKKNNSNELVIITYRQTYEGFCALRTAKLNDWGFAYSLKDEVTKEVDNLEWSFVVSNYNVTYLTYEPTITITLNSGLGKFADGSTEKEIVTPIGRKFSEIKTNANYEVPTLSGSGMLYSFDWFDDSGKFVKDTRMFFERTVISYGFVDSDYTGAPVIGFNFTSGIERLGKIVTFKVKYIDSENKGLTLINGEYYYHTDEETISFPIDGSNINIWGAFDTLTLSDQNGVYSEGNNYITYISGIRPIHVVDYAFANLERLSQYSQGSYTNMEFEIGNYAFYNCKALETVSMSSMAPSSIGNYAFAKTKLGAYNGAEYGKLFDCPLIKANAFAEIETLKYVLKSIILDYDEDYGILTVNQNTFNYKGWEENWNGSGENKPQMLLYIDYMKLTDGNRLILKATDSEITRFAVYISKSYTYDISVDVDTLTEASVSFQVLDDDTNISVANNANPIELDDYLYTSDDESEYYHYHTFTINNILADDDQIIIAITYVYIG